MIYGGVLSAEGAPCFLLRSEKQEYGKHYTERAGNSA